MPPPASGASVADASHAKESGVRESTGSYRPDQPRPRVGQPTGLGHQALGALPPALPLGDARLEKLEVRPDTGSETAALTTRIDVPLAVPSGTGSTPPLARNEYQAALFADRTAPADQIAPALVAILKTVEGAPSVTVRLQPPELGQVQIRLDQATTGAAHINITAERPDTLQLLQRDEPRLQQALDQAGMLTTGRTVSFHMASPEQTSASTSRPDSMGTGPGDSGRGQSEGAWRQNDDSPRDSGRDPESSQRQARIRWFRAGLDITA